MERKLTRLIIVRHGDYEVRSGKLSLIGIAQIEVLAGKLRPHVEGRRVRMLVSTATRAEQSAEILKKELDISDVELHGTLSSEEDRIDGVKAFELVDERSADDIEVLIVVTHLEYADVLPRMFAEQKLGWNVGRPEVGKGRACVLFLNIRELLSV